MESSPSRYINRELSWLEFNQRVLSEAEQPSVPLLERLKFLAITASNLDEFFMVRVGGLQALAAQGRGGTDLVGLTPTGQLSAIRERVRRLYLDQYLCYLEELEPRLAEAGMRRIGADELNEKNRRTVEQIFTDEIYPLLTPMAIADGDDLPLLVNCSLNLCVRLDCDAPDGPSSFVLLPFARAARFITLPSQGGYQYMLLEDVVAMFIDRFLPGERVVECAAFRITRNADLSVREDQAADLLSEMEHVLDARKESDCVRLEVTDQVSTTTLEFLQESLGLSAEDIYLTPGALDLSAFMRLASLEGFETLKYGPWPPCSPPGIEPQSSMFEVISRGDVLLSHPYESFEPVLRLIEEAADDPDVLAIKQTLYRTSTNSPVVAALHRAAQQGKSVAVIVELKARFDEARNIGWARHLEQSGVQVIYGVKGLKTHAKVCIIVRREPGGIRRYVHFGTGNYNEVTARLYTDVSFMTCDEDLASDALSFFNMVTGYTQPQNFRKLDAAPLGLRDRLLEEIRSETQRKQAGQHAAITAKMNSLVDPQVIDALYAASQAGVPVRLNVRGICCLRPGVKGLSENITVTSIVDRFLEHSRIFYFHHGGEERVFLSSADWMTRNLNRRVELLVPVDDPVCRRRLIEILETQFKDNLKAWRLRSDNVYERVRSAGASLAYRAQEVLYQNAANMMKQAERSRRTVFEPHRAPERST